MLNSFRQLFAYISPAISQRHIKMVRLLALKRFPSSVMTHHGL